MLFLCQGNKNLEFMCIDIRKCDANKAERSNPNPEVGDIALRSTLFGVSLEEVPLKNL